MACAREERNLAPKSKNLFHLRSARSTDRIHKPQTIHLPLLPLRTTWSPYLSAATGRVRTAIPYLHQELDNVHLSSALIVVPAMATISCHLRRKYYLQPTLRPRPSSHHDERNSLVISESNTRKDVDPDLINMACQTTWHICRCKLLLDMSTNRPQVRLHQTTPSIYWPQQQKDRCLRYISE